MNERLRFLTATAPRISVPRGACDCHVHLFGTVDQYPLAQERAYTPDPALLTDLIATLTSARIDRAVLVQPSGYGADNRCMLDALAAEPRRLRGVAVIDVATPTAELERMHVLGVRGVRLNLVTTGTTSPAETARLVDVCAAKIAPLGWHLQLFVNGAMVEAIAPAIAKLPIEVVFDHMGFFQAALGTSQRGLAALLRLLASGRTWVKLSGTYRVSPNEYGNPQVTALARTLIGANCERVVWASDWPHIGVHPRAAHAAPPRVAYRRIDYGRLVSVIADWADAGNIDRMLVHNPAKLYGFD
jgi:predicted TIM-barrel fold metal-dependent hydrolase